jgi:hypothetical protein
VLTNVSVPFSREPDRLDCALPEIVFQATSAWKSSTEAKKEEVPT